MRIYSHAYPDIYTLKSANKRSALRAGHKAANSEQRKNFFEEGKTWIDGNLSKKVHWG
jgi:hypothetical protein